MAILYSDSGPSLKTDAVPGVLGPVSCDCMASAVQDDVVGGYDDPAEVVLGEGGVLRYNDVAGGPPSGDQQKREKEKGQNPNNESKLRVISPNLDYNVVVKSFPEAVISDAHVYEGV